MEQPLPSLSDTSTDCIETICLNLLSNRLLVGLLPNAYLEADLTKRLGQTKTALAQHQALNDSDIDSIQSFVNRVYIIPRGQPLQRTETVPGRHTSTIASAMVQRKCLAADYNGSDRLLHPYGIVVRTPKIYLLAVEDDELQKSLAEDRTPLIKQFVCSRFSSLETSARNSLAPDDFNVEAYANGGNLDMVVDPELSQLPNPFRLKLRVTGGRRDNLRRDLEQYPLSATQTFIDSTADGDYELVAPGQKASYALIEWIVGRADRVEVLEPIELRRFVRAQLESTLKQYVPATKQLSEKHNFTLLGTSNILTATQMSDSITEPEPPVSRRSVYLMSGRSNSVVFGLVIRVLLITDIEAVLDSSDLKLIMRSLAPHSLTPEQYRDPKVLENFLQAESLKIIETHYDPEDPFSVNTASLANTLNLTSTELAILRLAYTLQSSRSLRAACNTYNRELLPEDAINLISDLLTIEVPAIAHALRPQGKLRSSGLVRTFGSICMPLELDDVLYSLRTLSGEIFREQTSPNGIVDSLILASRPSDLTQDDFSHLESEVELVNAYFSACIEARSTGANLLLWGPPGTGKTEFARYMIKRLECNAIEIPSADEDGDAMAATQRFESYRFSQKLFAERDNTLIIYDEVEEILSSESFAKNGFNGGTRGFSKGLMNSVLESNTVPAIWITNTTNGVDPAFLRRFDIAIEIKTPDKKVKARLAKRVLNELPVSRELLDEFLDREEIGPAQFEKISRLAQRMNVTDEASVTALASRLINGELTAAGHDPLKPEEVKNRFIHHLPYNENMINADTDLAQLFDDIDADSSIRLCLYGPPGTGKTAWAKQLSERLEVPALIKDSAELSGKYHGESEKRIKQAFDKATADKAVLIIDEVDSFLPSRHSDMRHYQVVIVNQFLTCMENYQGILVCSTNLMGGLDPATMRRFHYKVKFDYLTTEQANEMLLLLATTLGLEDPEQALSTCSTQLSANSFTPGDFAAVLGKHAIRKVTPSITELIQDLQTELGFRVVERRPMGFLGTG